MFLSEFAHKSFCVKFSGLINKLKILEISCWSSRIFNVQTYIWSLFKAKKVYGAPMKPSELFCFKDTEKFATLLFFLAACNKKIQRGKCDRYRVGWKWSTRRLVEDGMSTWLTNTRTTRGFSDLCHVTNSQCILCAALRYGCLTLLYVISIQVFFCPWNNRARLYILGCRLDRSHASSRVCSLAVISVTSISYKIASSELNNLFHLMCGG